MKIWRRHEQAMKKLMVIKKELETVLDLLEDANKDNIDSLCAVSEQILIEYATALEEVRVCDIAGNYANALEHYMLRTQRLEMLKIVRSVADDTFDRAELKEMAVQYLKDTKDFDEEKPNLEKDLN